MTILAVVLCVLNLVTWVALHLGFEPYEDLNPHMEGPGR